MKTNTCCPPSCWGHRNRRCTRCGWRGRQAHHSAHSRSSPFVTGHRTTDIRSTSPRHRPLLPTNRQPDVQPGCPGDDQNPRLHDGRTQARSAPEDPSPRLRRVLLQRSDRRSNPHPPTSPPSRDRNHPGTRERPTAANAKMGCGQCYRDRATGCPRIQPHWRPSDNAQPCLQSQIAQG